jgi:hypothetical protein
LTVSFGTWICKMQFASLTKLDLSLQLQKNQHVHIYQLLKH